MEIGHAQVPLVRARRILGDEVGTRRVDRLAVDRHRIRQVPGDRARLAVAEGADVPGEANPLDAARQVGGPADRAGICAALTLDLRLLLRRQVGIPAEPLEDGVGELGIAVLDRRIDVP
jgi:hypothetical protein